MTITPIASLTTLHVAASFGGKAAVKAALRQQRLRNRLADTPAPWDIYQGWKRVRDIEDGVLEKRFFPGQWSQEEIEELLEELYLPSYTGEIFTVCVNAYRVEGGVWTYHTKAYPT